MTVPTDSTNGAHRALAAAWLRVADEDGGGIRAALFETTTRGEPMAFGFTRADDGDAATVANSLLAAAPPPDLLLALADETPAGVAVNGPPLCRVSASGHPPQLHWESAQPAATSAAQTARKALAEITGADDPFEPFERAARALSAAFADPQVAAFTAIPGLNSVISLSAPARKRAQVADAAPAYETGRGSAGAPNPNPSAPKPREPTLAERLWAILGARPAAMQQGERRRAPTDSPTIERPRESWESQLEWAGKRLMPFQQEGVSALLDMEHLLLADDMGLGKTIQAIAALRILKERREIESCLIVAPASLLDQWRRELDKWAPELTAIIIRGAAADRSWQWAARRDAVLVSYDVLRADFGDNDSPIRKKTWDVVIADEAQRVKNRNDTSHALKALKRTRSWALTGTPIENDEEELASIMEFIDHDGQSETAKRYQPGPELMRRHRELQIRRKKGDVLDDLPDKLESKLSIDLHPRQRASYDRAEREGIVYLKTLGAEIRTTHVLELISRLKQICNIDPKSGESSKLDDIDRRLEELTARGHRALVFSQYTNEASGVAAVARRLRRFDPLTLTGETPQHERAEIIDRFKTRDRHKALVMSLRAGGLGLNLQEASYVFHLDRWWNPAIERQAEDRSHRIGQTVKVNVIKYSCADTIEERIDRILERKQELFDSLVDDVSLDLSARMSGEELLGLFGLR